MGSTAMAPLPIVPSARPACGKHLPINNTYAFMGFWHATLAAGNIVGGRPVLATGFIPAATASVATSASTAATTSSTC